MGGGGPEVKSQLGRSKRKCKTGVRKIVWKTGDCITVVQGMAKWRAVLNLVMKLRATYNVIS